MMQVSLPGCLTQDRRRQRQQLLGAGRCRHSAAPLAATAVVLGAARRTVAEDGAAAATAEVGSASPTCVMPAPAEITQRSVDLVCEWKIVPDCGPLPAGKLCMKLAA